jgi:iron complex outermembrane receptor protein
LQDDLRLWNRFSAILGARYQTTWAKTKPTPGLEDEPLYDSQDDAVVWATNFVFEAADYLNVVATVGTAFRSPNLIERFFNGLTPEGNGFQVRNPDLQPEESFNVDLGVKYRRNDVYFELGAFRNRIKNGIRIVGPLGTIEIGDEPFGVYQNQNIEELVYTGIEAALDWAITPAITVGLNYTKIDSSNETPEANYSVTEGYSDKLNVMGRYQDPRDRFWAELDVRYQGEQDDVLLADPNNPESAPNPVGDVFPAFTVVNLSGGVTLFRDEKMAHKLNLQANNLTNELYAEFSNVSFFRPEPERNYVLQYLFQF